MKSLVAFLFGFVSGVLWCVSDRKKKEADSILRLSSDKNPDTPIGYTSVLNLERRNTGIDSITANGTITFHNLDKDLPVDVQIDISSNEQQTINILPTGSEKFEPRDKERSYTITILTSGFKINDR